MSDENEVPYTNKNSMVEHNNRVLDNVLEMESIYVGKVRESDFKEFLLPILVNVNKVDSLDAWIRLTGSWIRPIDVYDDSMENKLFTVPALMSRGTDPKLRDKENSMDRVADMYQKKKERIPKAGEDYLHKNLTHTVESNGEVQRAIDTWRYIFNRYGVSHEMDDVEVVDNSTGKPDDDGLIEIYDD